ncbi:DUF4209 domain-containing protein [Aquimarina sp. AU119]|uniref:DUF4209 domain-containing protein n=1 Tax=Aquimarina sp. AU119 TaxID=2108528 RepID=UPI000D699A52|nr:DUF4209 domain-containing protein [Aquimarina sp. AU119]
MKSEEIDIEQFKSINELYFFVEKNAFILKRDWYLTDLWVRFKNQTKDEIEKKKSQWEIDCFAFNLSGNLLFSQIYSDGKNANEIKRYPDLSEFQKEVIEYIKIRIETSDNPILKARYNHLLWKCPVGIKRGEYALEAIENYIESIKEYYRLFEIDEHQDIPNEIGRLFETLITISNEIKSDKTELKKLTTFLLFKTEKFEFHDKQSILNDMLEFPKIYKPIDFANSLQLFEKELSKKTINLDDFMLVNYYLPTAIKIANKTKTDTKKWQNEIGLAYLRLAENETKEDRFWIKQDYNYKAIHSFKLSGNDEYRKKSEKLYADLKPKIKLPTITIPFTQEIRDLTEDHQKELKKRSEMVLERGCVETYRFISRGLFFPTYENVIKVPSKNSNAFLDFATTISFDKNKNITKQKASNNEMKRIFESYKYHMEMTVLPYLHNLIIVGIKSGDLSFENFISFLVDKTWIGKTHIRYDLGGNEQLINWIQQLSPSITEFFMQVQAWGSSKYYTPSFILCIDSFTLKMEGIFRDFCERLSIPTSFNRDKGMQEAYIHNVFDNEIIIKYFNEDDRLFFNYLFSNEGGLNLRNNVAHCFYNSNEYHPDKMLLLIAALLRLGKYDQKKVKKTSINNID